MAGRVGWGGVRGDGEWVGGREEVWSRGATGCEREADGTIFSVDIGRREIDRVHQHSVCHLLSKGRSFGFAQIH